MDKILDMNKIDRKNAIQFFADVEFGILGKNCKNYGICRIDIVDKIDQLPKTGKGRAIITVHNRNLIEMVFLRNSITSYNYQKYFSTNYFLIQEDYNSVLDNNIKISLLAGRYITFESKHYIKIIFNKNKNSLTNPVNGESMRNKNNRI